MSNDFVKNLVVEQRKRLVGSLMDYIERNVYQYLPPEERVALREKVLMAVGTYHDTILDIIKASVNDGSELNENALVMLRDLNRSIEMLKRNLRREVGT